MRQSPRQLRILRSAQRQGTVRIGDLAEEMGVSLETIRRDIRPLVEGGTLVKLHGAVSLTEAPFERRLRERASAKQTIARHVAASIADGDSVMLDTGTTTSILARELLTKRGLTIVTNSSDIARTLATVNGNRVYMAGGELRGDNGAAFGASAIAFASSFKVHHAIISIAGVDAEGGLMDQDLAEAEFARQVLQCGRRRLVITDHSKFNRSALVRAASFEEIDLLITDRAPPDTLAQRLEEAGTRWEVAGEPASAASADREPARRGRLSVERRAAKS
ncbi:MAG: DeoR/GlpR transcriptional regulator [Rhodospirillales bacterium]|nr:DeoR/GlpR transcriptional regulator [Rhodospirillales bacterium]